MRRQKDTTEQVANERDIQIVPIERAHVKRAADVIASAFLHEPGAVSVIRKSPEKRLRILRRHFLAQVTLNLQKGVSSCALYGNEIVGLMILSAPRDETVTTAGLITFLGKALLHASLAVIWRGLRSSLQDERHRPKEPNYYLDTLAVTPEFQRLGIGTRLLEHLTEKADCEKVLTYLSTTDQRTVPFYEKHGFRTISVTVANGTPNFHMVREPVRSSC